jgi:hypothetical protein
MKKYDSPDKKAQKNRQMKSPLAGTSIDLKNNQTLEPRHATASKNEEY